MQESETVYLPLFNCDLWKSAIKKQLELVRELQKQLCVEVSENFSTELLWVRNYVSEVCIDERHSTLLKNLKTALRD